MPHILTGAEKRDSVFSQQNIMNLGADTGYYTNVVDSLPIFGKKAVVQNYTSPKEDQYIKEFYTNDYFPRMQRENPNLTKEDLDKLKTNYNNTVFYIDPTKNKASGLNTPKGIVIGRQYKRDVVAHELAHRMRQTTLGSTKFGNDAYHSGYSLKEKQNLGPMFTNNPSWTKRAFGNTPYQDKRRELVEAGAVNTQTRYKVWRDLYQKLGRVPTLNETDAYIRQLSPEQLNTIFTGGYGLTMYINDLMKNGGYNSEDLKNSMIHVAQTDNKDKDTDMAKHGTKLVKRYS